MAALFVPVPFPVDSTGACRSWTKKGSPAFYFILTSRKYFLDLIIIMRTINGRHWLCFFLLVFPLSWAEDTKKDVRKTENDTVWSQAKARRLFARRKISPPQESNTPKHKSNLMSPARRCGRLMESCSAHVLCCDPCASCRCRLFNTICHCWRMNPLCLKKT